MANLNIHATLRVNNDVINREVIESLKAGDHMSYNRIYVKYHDQILRFIHSLIRSLGDAEELTQEIFVTLWAKKDQIDPAKNFNGYIYRMARNSVLNYIKARNVRAGSPLDAAQNEISEYISSEDIVVAREVNLIIELAISRMPEQRKRIMEMSRKEGLSNEEIADRLCIKKSSVEKQISYARKELKEILASFILIFM